MKKVTILGATGSVGMQALEVAREFKEEIDVVCLSAHSDIEGLAAAANEVRPGAVALTGNADVEKLRSTLLYQPEIISGENALKEAAVRETDMVLLSVLGIAGLPAFFACLDHKIPVALANKESLVCGADVARRRIDETGTLVVPVDSEHSGLFQCLNDSYDTTNVENFWITASGGPFLHASKEEIDNAPVERALKHPNWDMGQKITIDSASLANKGLEVIEAHFMFRMPGDRIKVVVQPQSLIHAMVEFKDTSLLAQLGPVDMRLPIQKAIFFPEMCKFTMNKPLNFWEIGKIEMIRPDMERFPCLKLAYDAIESGTTAVYNIADEVAVAAYIAGSIRFGRISGMIADCMEKFAGITPQSVEDIMELDIKVREFAARLLVNG